MIEGEHYVYIRWHKDKYVLLHLYLDIILIAKNDLEFLFKPLKDGYHPVDPQICLIPFKIFVQFSISGIKSWSFLFCYNPHHSFKKNPKRP